MLPPPLWGAVGRIEDASAGRGPASEYVARREGERQDPSGNAAGRIARPGRRGLGTQIVERLYDLIEANEDWLSRRILEYAAALGYAGHVAASEESWRGSVAGLSEALLASLDSESPLGDIKAGADLKSDPIAAYGISEARKHRRRGTDLALFLGLVKCYRRGYLDLIREAGSDYPDEGQWCRRIVRFFDRMELGFCAEWTSSTDFELRAEPQTEPQIGSRPLTGEQGISVVRGCHSAVASLPQNLDPAGDSEVAFGDLGMTIERSRTGESHLHPEELYRTLVESMEDAVFVEDAEGRFVSVNTEMSRRMGWHREDILGKTALEVYPPETALRVTAADQQVLKQGMVVETEEAYLTPWGPVAHHIRRVPLRDISGAVVGLVGIDRYATERQRAQEALQRREDRFRFLTDNVSDIIGLLAEDGTIHYISSSAERVLGHTPEELAGRRFPELVHTDDRAGIGAALEKAARLPGAAVSLAVRCRHQDGSFRTLEGVAVNHLTNPAVTGVVLNLWDITDHRHAQEELSKARDFYLTLLDEFPAPIWRSGTDTKYDYFNRSWLSFTGRTVAQELGDGWMQGVHPDDLAGRTGIYLDAFSVRKPYEAEYRLRRYDGEYRWMIDFGRPYYDLSGRFAGYIGSVYDITDRKMQEEQLGYLATHDVLTGLPNRRVLEEALARAVARARRGAKSSLLFLDLDDFKLVNDTFGHATGDQVLAAVTRLLQEQLRAGDLLARFAGDEFAVLLEGTGMEEAQSIAERSRHKVEEMALTVGDRQFHLTLSIGVVAIDGQESIGLLMSHADSVMYRAKEMGRNRVVVYQPEQPPIPETPGEA